MEDRSFDVARTERSEVREKNLIAELSRIALRFIRATVAIEAEGVHAPRIVYDAGASARTRTRRHARRGRGEGALRRPARLRRIVAGRTFLRDHRADSGAAV